MVEVCKMLLSEETFRIISYVYCVDYLDEKNIF